MEFQDNNSRNTSLIVVAVQKTEFRSQLQMSLLVYKSMRDKDNSYEPDKLPIGIVSWNLSEV